MLSLGSAMQGQQQLLPANLLLIQLFDPHHLYMSSYERKLFIFGLTNLMFGPETASLWAANSGGAHPTDGQQEQPCLLQSYLGANFMEGLTAILAEIICMLVR